MSHTTNEVDRETLALLTQSGFRFHRHGKHAIFRHDSGEQLSVSTSPSRERLKRIRSEINRALRRIEQRSKRVVSRDCCRCGTTLALTQYNCSGCGHKVQNCNCETCKGWRKAN
jgi:predicted RNA binding protein YcfA (HicA-like mRNA interferase family)